MSGPLFETHAQGSEISYINTIYTPEDLYFDDYVKVNYSDY